MVTTEVTLPELGRGVSSGELVAWLVEPGDRVAAEQTIAEVETDKSLVEVSAPATGVVTALHAEDGAQVAEGEVLADIDVDEGAAADAADAADAPAETEPDVAPDPDEQTATSQGAEPDVASGRVFAPPRVRRLARELQVDITDVEGTGQSGAITESDVRAAAEKRSGGTTDQGGPREFTGGTAATTRREGDDSESEPAADASDEPTPRHLSGGRSIVYRREGGSEPLAERVETEPETPAAERAIEESTPDETTPEPRSTPTGESSGAVADASPAVPAGTTAGIGQTAHHDEVDVTALQNARERLAATDVADGQVTDLAFAVAAVAAALESVPALNGPVADGEIDRRDRINVAIGIRTEDGLVEPVVVDADDVAFPILAREVAELAERATAGSLEPAETADGTFTVTDFGALGGTYATPDVAAIGTSVLALGEIRERPRMREGEVSARAILPLSTTVDGRAVDGADAAQFTAEVRRYLNTPELLLL